MTEKKIILGIVASGSGTDANAIMSSWRRGQISNVSKIILFGTKEDAGCFSKAFNNNIGSRLVECKDKDGVPDFNQRLKLQCEAEKIDMLFLAGCVWEIYTRELGIPVFNIHPAFTKNHGGRHMYGLAVHKHVLAQIKDEIFREVRSVVEDFFTQICVHQVHHAAGIDGGKIIITVDVPIPKNIILKLVNDADIKELAEELQKYVLQYEHMILPSAVNILAKMEIDLDKIKNI